METWFNEHFEGLKRMAQYSQKALSKPTSMVLTIENFRVLSFEKKCDIITFQGNYLMQRVLADCKIFLYYTDGFYIEVFYSPKHQKVLMINAFDNTIGLKPYLDKISLDDLIS